MQLGTISICSASTIFLNLCVEVNFGDVNKIILHWAPVDLRDLIANSNPCPNPVAKNKTASLFVLPPLVELLILHKNCFAVCDNPFCVDVFVMQCFA